VTLNAAGAPCGFDPSAARRVAMSVRRRRTPCSWLFGLRQRSRSIRSVPPEASRSLSEALYRFQALHLAKEPQILSTAQLAASGRPSGTAFSPTCPFLLRQATCAPLGWQRAGLWRTHPCLICPSASEAPVHCGSNPVPTARFDRPLGDHHSPFPDWLLSPACSGIVHRTPCFREPAVGRERAPVDRLWRSPSPFLQRPVRLIPSIQSLRAWLLMGPQAPSWPPFLDS
jgi:hypothetical protein